MDIDALIGDFEACRLPAAEWTHGAHLTVALSYLVRHPRPEATLLIRQGIRRYNESLGKVGYHETITLAWIAVISAFLAETGRDEPVAALARRLVERCGARDHLTRHYSRERLMSDEARREWVEPDREPLE